MDFAAPSWSEASAASIQCQTESLNKGVINTNGARYLLLQILALISQHRLSRPRLFEHLDMLFGLYRLSLLFGLRQRTRIPDEPLKGHIMRLQRYNQLLQSWQR